MVSIKQIRFASLPASVIASKDYRLDASAYKIEAMMALKAVHDFKDGYVLLWSNNGLIKEAYYPGRFKRIYCDEKNGIPFYIPSQLEDVFPKASKFIAPETANKLEKDRIKENLLLTSRSGTIGKCTISSETTIGKYFSDDVIRISFINEYDLGFVYAYFKSNIGLTILQSNNYGAVVDHIEPEHLCQIPVPNVSIDLRKSIHNLIIDSFKKRDESNKLIEKAQNLLYKELKLPKIFDIKPKQYDDKAKFRCFSLNMSRLDNRLDVSYHLPSTEAIIDEISKESEYVTKVKDKRITSQIVLPGRFKRVYVDEDHGVPFFGGKQLLQLTPTNLKYLSKTEHASRIKKQLTIKQNWCVVTCSGTIGKVNIVPKHWEGWTLNQHVLRLIPKDNNIAGYLYAWIESPYCKPLILRNSYGAVIDELDDIQMGNVPVPILKNKQIMKAINDKVLAANDLRYEAFLKEKEAIQKINDLFAETFKI